MKAMRLLDAAATTLTAIAAPAPQPGPGELLLDVVCAGLCHTDVGTVLGYPALRRGYSPAYPVTLGARVPRHRASTRSGHVRRIAGGDARRRERSHHLPALPLLWLRPIDALRRPEGDRPRR